VNNRRKLVIALGTSALTAPFASWAQSQTKVWRIGILLTGSSTSSGYQIAAFLNGMEKLGYAEGNNIALLLRFGEGKIDRLPMLAADLVARNVDIIFTSTTPATRAAKQATASIPIVFGSAGDPVAAGLVASLAKPGGNVTGLSVIAADLAAKRLEILKEIVPKIARIVLFVSGATPQQVAEVERAVKSLGMQALVVQLERPDDVKRVAMRLKEWHADSIFFLDSGLNMSNRTLLGDLAVATGLPAISSSKQYPEAGVLISYGANLEANYNRAATYVDKIFRGTKPGDIPIEQPTKLETVINLRTAKALGIKIPSSILVQATTVIE